MNKVFIPATFSIFGQEITVRFLDTLTNEQDAIGIASDRTNSIRLQANVPGKPMTDDQMGQAFYHELMHTILALLGEGKLSKNEQFVDLVGQCLYQFEKTKES